MVKKRSTLNDEGVIRFALAHQRGPAPSSAFVRDINLWRTLFHRLGWIGQDPRRYHGWGFGNVSRRWPGRSPRGATPAFVVSGTQTGRRVRLSNRDYTRIVRCVPLRNQVTSIGPVAPSSESMTHGQIYRLCSHARYAIHVHAPVLWANARALALPQTRRGVSYGTPAMAREVARLIRRQRWKAEGVFSMGGHRDGIFAFAATGGRAGWLLLNLLNRIPLPLRTV